MPPVSVTYFSIPGYAIFWALFIVAIGLFVQRAYLLFRLLRLGQKENRSDNPWRRFRYLVAEVFLQRCNLKSVTPRDLAGIGHAFLFWCFGLFLVSYFIFIGLSGGFGLYTVLEGSLFETVYKSILDIAGILVVIAIAWAVARRYIMRPSRLERSPEGGMILFLVFSLMVLHFCIEGFGYAAYHVRAAWPLIGNSFAGFLSSTGLSVDALTTSYRAVWWLHYAVILGFMVYIPRSKHLHILVSPFNVYFRSLESKGSLKQVELEQAEIFGVSKVQDFSWKQLLDFYSCAECGRCHISCPARTSGKRLSPREVVLNLKKHLLAKNNGKSMIGDAVTEEEIWDCTTCRACQEVCPVAVEHVDTILDMRRDLVLMRAKFPAEVKTFFKNMEENGNPWPKPWVSRAYWSEGLGIKKVGQDGDVNTVFWVGCLAAYDERIQRVAIALSRIFKTAGIDFGILGKEERCCGDAVRRIGNEYLFQKLAYHNINFLTKHGVKRIITHCPHGFNTLKNEYPKLGGNFEVIHHTELIADLLNNGDLKPPTKELNQTVVYHDPCYLSRYNDISNYPRRILASVPKLKLVEKAQCMKNTFCCGAGGGRMWMSETGGQRISQVLLEQVMSKKPDVLVTACPYCLTMLDNEVREKGLELSLKVMDIAELFQSVA